MQQEYLDKVKVLREAFPIGLSRGIALLNSMNGDIEKVMALLIEESLAMVIEKTQLPFSEAKKYLVRFKYDAIRCISVIEEDYQIIDGVRYNKIAYNLKRWQHHKEHAIHKVASIIEEQKQLKRPNHYWLTETILSPLEIHNKCIVTLCEWLDYVYAEGVGQAVHFNNKITVEQILSLRLNDLAEAMRFTRNKYLKIYDAHRNNPDRHQIIYKQLSEDTDYHNAISFIEKSKEMVIEKLYNFIDENLEHLSE